MAGQPGRSGGLRIAGPGKKLGRPKEKIILRVGEEFGLMVQREDGMRELTRVYRVRGVIGKRSKTISVFELPSPSK